MVTAVENALFAEHSPDWRGPQLRDLRIAHVHAQFLPFKSQLSSPALGHELLDSMREFPRSMWGDFIEAANAMDMFVPVDDRKTFLRNVIELSRPPSDQFAHFIGLAILNDPDITDPVHCLENCGITKAQIEDVIIPSCAVSLLEKIADRRGTIKAGCERWGAYADLLAAKMEDSIYLLRISSVRHYDASMRRLNLDVGPQRLSEKQAAVIRGLEPDTIQALGNNQSGIDAFAERWQFANTLVLTVEEWVKKFDVLTSETIPLVCQPALLDCWALALSRQMNRLAEMDTHAGAVFTSLTTAITLPALQRHPKLLGRMYVALIHALEAGVSTPSQETLAAQKQWVAELFEKVPRAGWGSMLELTTHHGNLLDRTENMTRISDFILDRQASVSASWTPSFLQTPIATAAAKIWEQLPDQADDARSKFDVFCDRFGLTDRARAAAKKKILNGIVERASSGKYTVSEGLLLSGFDADASARRFARKAFDHHPGSVVSPNDPAGSPDDGHLQLV